MKDEELEDLLATLRPAPLPPQLRARLEAPAPARRRAVLWRWTLAPLAAAACWWLLSPLWVREASPRPSKTRETAASDRVVRTVEETSRLVKVKDLPILNPGSPDPVGLRLVQWEDNTTYTGENPRVVIHKQQPRLQLVAVSFQTY